MGNSIAQSIKRLSYKNKDPAYKHTTPNSGSLSLSRNRDQWNSCTGDHMINPVANSCWRIPTGELSEPSKLTIQLKHSHRPPMTALAEAASIRSSYSSLFAFFPHYYTVRSHVCDPLGRTPFLPPPPDKFSLICMPATGYFLCGDPPPPPGCKPNPLLLGSRQFLLWIRIVYYLPFVLHTATHFFYETIVPFHPYFLFPVISSVCVHTCVHMCVCVLLLLFDRCVE